MLRSISSNLPWRQDCGDRHPAPTSGLWLSRPHCLRFYPPPGEQVLPGSTPKDTVRTTVTWPSFYSHVFLVLRGLKNWIPAEKIVHLPVCQLKVWGCPHRQWEERMGLPDLEVEAKFRSGHAGRRARGAVRAWRCSSAPPHPKLCPRESARPVFSFFFTETTYLPQRRCYD